MSTSRQHLLQEHQRHSNTHQPSSTPPHLASNTMHRPPSLSDEGKRYTGSSIGGHSDTNTYASMYYHDGRSGRSGSSAHSGHLTPMPNPALATPRTNPSPVQMNLASLDIKDRPNVELKFEYSNAYNNNGGTQQNEQNRESLNHEQNTVSHNVIGYDVNSMNGNSTSYNGQYSSYTPFQGEGNPNSSHGTYSIQSPQQYSQHHSSSTQNELNHFIPPNHSSMSIPTSGGVDGKNMDRKFPIGNQGGIFMNENPNISMYGTHNHSTTPTSHFGGTSYNETHANPTQQNSGRSDQFMPLPYGTPMTISHLQMDVTSNNLPYVTNENGSNNYSFYSSLPRNNNGLVSPAQAAIGINQHFEGNLHGLPHESRLLDSRSKSDMMNSFGGYGMPSNDTNISSSGKQSGQACVMCYLGNTDITIPSCGHPYHRTCLPRLASSSYPCQSCNKFMERNESQLQVYLTNPSQSMPEDAKSMIPENSSTASGSLESSNDALASERIALSLSMRVSRPPPVDTNFTQSHLSDDGGGRLSTGKSSRRVKKFKQCQTPGCERTVRSKGLCKGHGGGRRCGEPKCGLSDQGGGYCIKHGGGKKCNYEGCKSSAQSRGLCKLHGGGSRCTKEGCTKSSQGKGLCRAHGGGKRCSVPNCNKTDRRAGFCVSHGADKKCTVLECSKTGRINGLCSTHYHELQRPHLEERALPTHTSPVVNGVGSNLHDNAVPRMMVATPKQIDESRRAHERANSNLNVHVRNYSHDKRGDPGDTLTSSQSPAHSQNNNTNVDGDGNSW